MTEGVNKEEGIIVFFDGHCNICNGLVRFLIDRDTAGRFEFASLGSAFTEQFFEEKGNPYSELDSIMVYENGCFYAKSDAALVIVGSMKGGWRLLRGLRILPKCLRDWLYGVVARNRYRLFGRRKACRIPTAEEAERFLD